MPLHHLSRCSGLHLRRSPAAQDAEHGAATDLAREASSTAAAASHTCGADFDGRHGSRACETRRPPWETERAPGESLDGEIKKPEKREEAADLVANLAATSDENNLGWVGGIGYPVLTVEGCLLPGFIHEG